MNPPTPRTDAAWSSSFDGEQMSAGQTARALRECSQKLELEVAALRAENATLRAAQKACEACDEPTAFEVRQLRARAERAEASLHAMRLVCGTTDADKFTTWVDRANARAEKAEAELAAAKERLRSEAMDDYASIKNLQRELATEREKAERYRLVTLKQDAELAAERARLDSGTILLTVAGERVWHCGVDLRAAIDAAMKEDAK